MLLKEKYKTYEARIQKYHLREYQQKEIINKIELYTIENNINYIKKLINISIILTFKSSQISFMILFITYVSKNRSLI